MASSPSGSGPESTRATRARVAAPLAGGDLAAAGAQLVLVEWTAEAGGEEPPNWLAPLHVHDEDDEAWYVLSGRLGFLVDGERFEVGAGDAVLVPRGSPHTFCNAHPGPSRFVIVMTHRIKAITDEVAQLEDPSDADIAAVFRRNGGRMLGRPWGTPHGGR